MRQSTEKKGMSHSLSASMEDYLEAAALLEKKNGHIRVKDLSMLMKVRKPSVTGALNNLADKGFIAYERYGRVELTKKGKRIAAKVQARHDLLVYFLTQMLGVDKKTAAKEACQMEHAVSPQTFLKFARFVKTLNH